MKETLQQYRLCLQHSETDQYDLAVVSRVCNMWFTFESRSAEFDAIANDVPSYRFVPLIYQLASRLEMQHTDTISTKDDYENINSRFQKSLQTLVYRCAVHHPHHTLPVLLALTRGGKVTDELKRTFEGVKPEKVNAAKYLLDRLRRNDLGETVTMVKVLTNTYMDLALSNQSNPVVFTAPLNVRQSGDYSNVPRIIGFEENVVLGPSGIHKPKVVIAIGSDGHRYKQLLRIRTYRVVPLSPNSGVIEWVENTATLADYLWRNRKLKIQTFNEICAHFQPVLHHYFLENFPLPLCTFFILNEYISNEFQMVEIYIHITGMWYAKRMTYTRSVASTSMVGHILGIGDRHTQNILIDNSTAEVLHIDFGIVFEQGLELPTPEIVPFRLTRDIIDGMGVTGVEGTFRRCCEESLRVLRDAKNRDIILTILEVFIHDPCTPEALRLQHDQTPDDCHTIQQTQITDTNIETTSNKKTNHVSNLMSRRVLKRVKQKLLGQEEQNGDTLGITGHVARLINEAKDPEKNAFMYHGWASWV
eukprot:GSMAST32.ASY1.ANO1.1332.1 assembled CDS